MGKSNIAGTKYANPSNSMTEKEMQLMVEKAQEGKFYSLKVLQQKIALWKQQYPH